MRRIIYLLVVMLIPYAGFSQESLSSKLRNQFEDCEGCTMVSIKKLMFDLFLQVDNEMDPQAKEMLGNLNEILILELDPDDLGGVAEMTRKITKLLPEKDYEEIMEMKDGDENIQFLVRRKGKAVAEFVMYIHEGDEATLICLDGDLDLDNLGALSGSMNLPGFEKLDSLK